jgi:hypothetical protein
LPQYPALIHFKSGATLIPKASQSKFHIGQTVRVVAGTLDPDYGDPIAGWSGGVEDIYLSDDDSIIAWTYCIQWDSDTMMGVGRAFQKQCERDNLDAERMVLAEHEIVAH